ncbi:WYL domain-containing protein, partial [Candidatus Bipolaricaulota bacterium]|nr:WYL domain-containing protein [Candidatus Bipolaricaulota bacterium]
VDHLSTIHEATMNDRWVNATFERPFGIMITRRIAPYGVVARAGDWFVVWAGEDAAYRVDRLSRIRGADLEDERFEREEGFDLQAFWTDWRSRQEAGRPEYAVQLLVRKDAVTYVKDELGAQQGVFYGVPTLSDEWVSMTVAFPFLEEARRQLLALGGAVEVIRPEPLRQSIADFAQQITNTYSKPNA